MGVKKMETIRVLDINDCEEAQTFLFDMVESLFDKKRDMVIHRDIFQLRDFYIEESMHILIGAFDESNKLVGTIALKGFIDRFESFKNRYNCLTAEVGRCYISENMRRRGIGKRLFEVAIEKAREMGYEVLYLHTHLHLPGGYEFWLKSGFSVFAIDETLPQTIHMELYI